MELVFLDTETTGTKEEDRICQLSYLVTDENFNIKEIYDDLINPPIPISYEAMAIHNITNEMVEDKPEIKHSSSFKRLKELNSKDNLLIIHNAEFDLKMLKKEGFNSHFTIIDTFRVLKHLIPEGKFSLQYNRYALGLYKEEPKFLEKFNLKVNAHNAIGDVIVLYFLTKHLVKEFNLTLGDLVELTNKPIINNKFYFGKYKFRNIVDVIKEDPDYIEYLLEIEDLDKDLRHSIEYYLKNIDFSPEYRFKVGKYEGMLIENVLETDRQYLEWAYNHMQMSKGMKNYIKHLLEK